MQNENQNIDGSKEFLRQVRQVLSTAITRVRYELAPKLRPMVLPVDELRSLERALVAIREFLRAAIGTKGNPSNITLNEAQKCACVTILKARDAGDEFHVGRQCLPIVAVFPDARKEFPECETPRQRKLRERNELLAKDADEKFRRATLSLGALFNELEKCCLGFAGAVLTIGAKNSETWTVRFGGSDLMRHKALSFAQWNLDYVKYLSKKNNTGCNRYNCVTDALRGTDAIGAVLTEIEQRGLASYVTAIDRNACARFAGNAVQEHVQETDLLEHMRDEWEDYCNV